MASHNHDGAGRSQPCRRPVFVTSKVPLLSPKSRAGFCIICTEKQVSGHTGSTADENHASR